MAERWSGFGEADSDQEVANARNRQWEELWGTEENDWGDEEDEDEDEEPEVRDDEDEEPERDDEDEDEDDEWQSVIEGNWEDDEEEEDYDWEEEEQPQVKLEEKQETTVVQDQPEQMEEDEEEDSQISLEALRVLDRLKSLNCPFIKGLYKIKLKTAKQFLCTPSNYRLDILAWLFTRLHPPFQESFDTWQDSNAEDKIIDLTRLGHKLKLCRPDDHDLIKGCTQGKRQLGFMNEAMNLIESLSSEFSDKRARSASSKSSPPKPLGAKIKVEELSEKLNKLTEMLQAHKEEVLCRQEGTTRLFSPYPAGFPKKDLKAVTEAKATSMNVEQEQACLSGGDCMMTLGMQSLLPKPVTTQATQHGVPSLESELGTSP